ncbi:PTS sugar transporter subunit IIA [Thermodesulfobacteriota bacterium]
MKISEFLSQSRINLELEATTKEEVLKELVDLLNVDSRSKAILLKMINKREKLGSTGMGKGVAIPHGRSLVANRLMMSCGVSVKGIEYDSFDGKPAHLFFLIVAPAQEISNQYLPILGRIAQISRYVRNTKKLLKAKSPEDFLALLEEIETSID